MASLSFDLFRSEPDAVPRRPAPLEPRTWQRHLIQLLRARLHDPDPSRRDVLLHAGPGAGKTLGALLGFQRMRKEGHLDVLLVFCHRTSIARQWYGAAERLGLRLREWGESDPTSTECATAPDGWLLSYQAAARQREHLTMALPQALSGQRWLAIADEVHHLGLDPDEPESTAWGQAFSELTAPARLRLGLSDRKSTRLNSSHSSVSRMPSSA